ncbi:hypothetical protein, partial [Rhodanobacter denitrificans]|uniref:hypothetical protein n=1 Tax=Rhodanobacter denitrificans TaxID=666685 RepID=UPI001CB97C14
WKRGRTLPRHRELLAGLPFVWNHEGCPQDLQSRTNRWQWRDSITDIQTRAIHMANPAISVGIGRVRDAANGKAREQQREAETSSKRFHGRSPKMTTTTNTARRTHNVRGGTAFTTAG